MNAFYRGCFYFQLYLSLAEECVNARNKTLI